MKLTRRGKWVFIFSGLIVFIGIPLIGGLLFMRSIGVLIQSDPGPRVTFEIPEGSNLGEIGTILRDEGVIRSPLGLRIAAYLKDGDENIQAGRYKIPQDLSARDALDALLEGPVVEFVEVTFPEGSWLSEFARIVGRETHISEEEFLEVANSGEIRSRYQPDGVDSLEGLLFPATYQVVESDTAESLIRRFVDEFDDRMKEALKGRTVSTDPYEGIIIASMIEAEAYFDDERARIARVIYNRIDAGDRLGIDATVLYAIQERKQELTVSDLAVESPYNTRQVTGLPPTPIGASGQASLEAAFNPVDGDWYFYVLADCEGHHAFSTNNDDFLADKARYQSLTC